MIYTHNITSEVLFVNTLVNICVTYAHPGTYPQLALHLTSPSEHPRLSVEADFGRLNARNLANS